MLPVEPYWRAKAPSQIHSLKQTSSLGHDGQRKRVAHMPTATTTKEDSSSKVVQNHPLICLKRHRKKPDGPKPRGSLDGDRVCRPTRFLELNVLIIITNAAAQLADLRYEAHFRKRRRSGTRLWKQVGPHLSDLTFRLLSRGRDCRTIRVAIRVL